METKTAHKITQQAPHNATQPKRTNTAQPNTELQIFLAASIFGASTKPELPPQEDQNGKMFLTPGGVQFQGPENLGRLLADPPSTPLKVRLELGPDPGSNRERL